ncbi:MAG: hypothetical protein KBS52_02605 [Clostridiales bacterium]|nr:hypothetical protein [Candidatus Equinaster intestinalis]
MKRLIAIIGVAVLVCGIFSACKGSDFKVPENLMTTDEYHAELENLLKVENLSVATEEYYKKLDELDRRLEEQIVYNTDDVTECEGTKYYVSNSGNDENDGKSPKNAWATLEKVNLCRELKKGDLVLFERGGVYRGYVSPQSGVTYAAYGEGPKPQIRASIDGKADCTWEKTEYENVWKRTPNEKQIQKDMGFVLLKKDGEEICCVQKTKMSALKENYQFVFAGTTLKEGKRDFCVYLYYDGGNPGEVFDEIDLPSQNSVFDEGNIYIEDVHLNNLALLYGTGPFWPGDCKDISVTYCECRWSGGFADEAGGTRYGGGGGCWGSCDVFIWDHCLIYQQWDSGVSPQFKGPHDGIVNFKDLQVTNCMFKGVKWPLEYWLDQGTTEEDKIEGMIFNYNMCRDGDKGFNTNRGDASYIKSWGYQNTCYNCEIMHNVFDRAPGRTLEIGGHIFKNGKSVISDDHIPKLGNNLYIQKQNKRFALINAHDYKFNDAGLEEYMKSGYDTDSVFLYAD